MNALPLATWLLFACGPPDADGDGVDNSRERALGLDPFDVDSDRDGLEDGDELAAGTDPLDPDTDDDAILDGNEAAAGTDPLDPDTDDDGLTDGDELVAGSDPLDPDTDGDGLGDGDEVAYGADPTVVDSDGDTYSDFHEVVEKTDPSDPNNRIYTGYWPYVYDKDGLNAPVVDVTTPVDDQGSFLVLGEPFARISGIDQHRERVDLYDFYDPDGTPVVLHMVAMWHTHSHDVGGWLEGQGADHAFEERHSGVRRAVDRGDLRWVTIIAEGWSLDTGDPQEAADWHDLYPLADSLVITDELGNLRLYTGVQAWPHLLLLEGDLTVAALPGDAGFNDVLDALSERFP